MSDGEVVLPFSPEFEEAKLRKVPKWTDSILRWKYSDPRHPEDRNRTITLKREFRADVTSFFSEIWIAKRESSKYQ